MRFVFREGPVFLKNFKDADPQKLGEWLYGLKEKHDNLSTQTLVEAARNPRCPAHRHLEWDDALAGNQWRMHQMNHIIEAIRIVDRGESNPRRALLSITDEEGRAWRTYSEVAGSITLQASMLKQAERDLLSWENRYRELKEICDLIRNAREKVGAKREELEARASV